MSRMTPVNMSVEGVHAASGLSGVEMPTPPEADELDNWAQENYSLSASAAASLGFPVGSLTATVQRDALMFGSSRWKDVVAGEHTYRFGLALRALVVVSDIKGSGALTLPFVAAKVELEGARASAQLLVRGYKGDNVGGLLPTWQSFGVDSYAQYMTAVSDLQKAIMVDSGTSARIAGNNCGQFEGSYSGRGDRLGVWTSCDRRRRHARPCPRQARD